MYAWTMLTKFNCQSAIHVKKCCYILLYSGIILYSFTFVMSAHGLVSFVFEVALPELLKEPHHASSFHRDLIARRNLYTTATRASGLAANWLAIYIGFIMMKHKVQISIHFKYFIWLDIATIHAWMQLAVVLAYYANTLSSIRRDTTRSLSFIIISVWLFGVPKWSKILF